jgi:hypothetical protein
LLDSEVIDGNIHTKYLIANRSKKKKKKMKGMKRDTNKRVR